MYNIYKQWPISENITPALCTLFRETLDSNSINIRHLSTPKRPMWLCIGYKMDIIPEAEYYGYIKRKNSARKEQKFNILKLNSTLKVI